jgi:hypothetical protein
MNQGKGLLLVMMGIDPEYGEEFNVWGNEEHVPKLLSIPCYINPKVAS